MQIITDEVREMLLAHEGIDNEQTIIVNFDVFNASSVDFMFYGFSKITNWVEYYKIKQDVLKKVAAIIEKHNAEIVFQTQTLTYF